MQHVVTGPHVLLISKPILDETLGILARKFGLGREQLAATALLLTEPAEWVEPDITIAALADEPDNRILECAVAGRADRIVTGDKAMLALASHGGTVIVTLAAWRDESGPTATDATADPRTP